VFASGSGGDRHGGCNALPRNLSQSHHLHHACRNRNLAMSASASSRNTNTNSFHRVPEWVRVRGSSDRIQRVELLMMMMTCCCYRSPSKTTCCRYLENCFVPCCCYRRAAVTEQRLAMRTHSHRGMAESAQFLFVPSVVVAAVDRLGEHRGRARFACAPPFSCSRAAAGLPCFSSWTCSGLRGSRERSM